VSIELIPDTCRVKFIQTDTTSWESQLAAFKVTLAWTSSRLDIVIPNAGVGGVLNKASFSGLSPLDDPPKPPILPIEVNLNGVYYTAMLAVHYFNARTSDDKFKPQLCFVSSLAGYSDLPFSSDYAAAKWGVRGIWRSLRGERGVNGLGGTQTNLIAPTYIRTAMTAGFLQSLVDAGVKVGEVEDVAQAILRAIVDEGVDGKCTVNFAVRRAMASNMICHHRQGNWRCVWRRQARLAELRSGRRSIRP
jgi:5'-hydroxyaverantin dehydrogenase